MGYSHIGIEERRQIARLLKAGTTIRQIAASLDRSPSAISREVNRNRLTSGEYRPVPANERAQARRWRGPRLDRDDLLREAVLWRLAWGASPEQVAGRLALEMGRPVISDETIYRFIYGQASGEGSTTGGITCRRRRRSGAGAPARGAVPPCSSVSAARWRSGPRRPPAGSSSATGRPTRCCSAFGSRRC